MAEVTEERITQAVDNIKAALGDGLQWEDISVIVDEITGFAEVFALSGSEKKALALRVAQRVLNETDIPILPDKFKVPFLGDIGADALLMRVIPGMIDLVIRADHNEAKVSEAKEA